LQLSCRQLTDLEVTLDEVLRDLLQINLNHQGLDRALARGLPAKPSQPR
jgi:hypothetical protein